MILNNTRIQFDDGNELKEGYFMTTRNSNAHCQEVTDCGEVALWIGGGGGGGHVVRLKPGVHYTTF